MQQTVDWQLSTLTYTQKETKNMNAYYINEQMLGSEATVANAKLMVELLREHGHEVEYGEPVQPNSYPPFNDNEWAECLDLISKT